MSFMLTLVLKKNFHHYLRNCQYADILVAFPGKNLLVSNFAKLSLALLCRHLGRNQVAKSLSLTQSDIHTILKVLSNKTLSEDEQKLFWHVFTKSELLLALKGFFQLKGNCIDFIKQDGLSVLAVVLECIEKEEQEAIVVLLWQLSHLVGPNIVEYGHKLMTTLSHLPADKESNLSVLKIVVPHCAFQSLPEDDKYCCMYAELAYKHELYEECVSFCGKVIQKKSHNPSTINYITLLHGKACFYIFKQNLLMLKKIPKNSPDYFREREVCIREAKQAIQSLGDSLDNSYIDEEGSYLLDTVIMLALSESFTFNRCLLCRSKQKKLIQSHICSHAILRDFADVCGVPVGGRPFLVNWPWQLGLSGNWKSPREVAVRLLCHDCEEILSKNESLFLPKFFRRFYDKSNPSSVEAEQDIEYGEWLYQFLVGLIFRGLSFQYSGGRNEFLNEETAYSAFTQCREALLNLAGGPQISLYIAPISVTDELKESFSLINTVIHHPFQCFFTEAMSLFKDYRFSSHALSYTFRIGMIMATINFSLAEEVHESTLISPKGGTFHVLPNHARQQVIPDTLWKTLQVKAMELEKQMMEQPERKALPKDLDSVIPPSSYMKSIKDADVSKTSSQEGIKVSALEFQPKVINYIPSSFSVSHYHDLTNPAGKLVVPNGHEVLLHLTIPNSREEGSTAFILYGKDTEYGPQKPYLILHYYKPGLQTNYGFFFSPSTFEFSCHLPDRTPKRFLDDGLKSSGLLEKSRVLISRVLKTKGFRNYCSLQYWIHSKRTPSVIDTKCKFKNGLKCWYCSDLCEICLEPSAFGPSCTDSVNNSLQFCSNKCYDLYNNIPRPQSKFFSPNDQRNPERRVPTGHKEYLHLSSCGKLDNGSAGFITSLSLCEGDGSKSFPIDQYYVNFHLRMPQYQGFLELFVSDELQPLSSVSYADASHNLFEQSEENALKIKALSIVHDTVRSFGAASVTDFVQKLKLYDTIGCTPVMRYGGENKQEKEAKEISAHGDENRLTEQNPESGENKLEKEAKKICVLGDEDRLAEENPESRDEQLIIDPIKLQEMLQQCRGDHEKLVDMMQKLMASPDNHTEAKDNGAVATGVTHGEHNEAR